MGKEEGLLDVKKIGWSSWSEIGGPLQRGSARERTMSDRLEDPS